MKQLINKYLRKLGVEVHGTGYLQALAKGEFKKNAFDIQKDYCNNPAPVIFDLGANNGDISKIYLEYFSSARIFAFEPFPDSAKNYKSNFKDDARVKCFELAISDVKEEKNFFVNKNVDTNSLLKPQKSGLSSDAQVENISVIKVQSITLDEFCKQNNIDHIDILKMDIQGGELNALKGAVKLLKENKIGMIYMETYFVEQYEGHPLFHDLSKFLSQFNFYLQDIYNPIYGKGSIAWADAIFKMRII